MAGRGIVRVVSRALMLLPAVCVGCSASGYPGFVKFAPGGHFLLYEDARHPRVYVYYLQTQKKHVLVGEVACVDPGVTRFVLRPGKTADPIPCSLVKLSGNEPLIEPLPPLPTTEGILPVAVIAFGPRPDTLMGVVYRSKYDNTPAAYYTLRLGQKAWKAHAVPETMKGKRPWEWFPPVGLRDSGFVYAPIYEPGAVPEDQKYGLNVEPASSDRFEPFHRLPSPDGRFIVTIGDVDDPWRRLTLTEAATGRKTLLLDKNDVPEEVFTFLVELPGRLLLTLLGVQF